MTSFKEPITNYVGIDVSKLTLCLYDANQKKNFKIENKILEITKFFESYNTSSLIVYEPTNVYCKNLEMVLNNLKLIHLQIHPNDSHHLMQALLCKNKNDNIDAQQLAQLGKVLYQQVQDGEKSKFIQPNDNDVNQILHYMTQIRFIKEQIVKCKQQLEVLTNSPYDSQSTKKFINDTIANFEKQIDQIIEMIMIMIEKIGMMNKYNHLKTIPGVGSVIALDMLVFYFTLERKGLLKDNKKQMIAYSGLNPLEHQSGSSLSGSSLSKKGNKHVRCMVYITGIQRSKRCTKTKYEETILGKFTKRMKEKFSSTKSKRGKSVGCAVGKKILELGWAMYRSESDYKFC